MISTQNEEEHLHDQRFSLQNEGQGKEDYAVGSTSGESQTTKDYYDATCCDSAPLLRLTTILSVINCL